MAQPSAQPGEFSLHSVMFGGINFSSRDRFPFLHVLF
jgi:hypothetical protein